MSDYLDASAIVSILLDEASSDAVLTVAQGAEGVLLISDFGITEVSSAISQLIRTRRRSNHEAHALVEELDGWVEATAETTRATSADIAEATAIVRQFDLKLRAPDALHLAICRRLEARLITLDIRLANAAKALGVAYINPADA